jgi:serine/threonine protein kinase/Flp pilus assembly protein TadD
MGKDFTSGAEPEQLRQLFSIGLGETPSEQQIDRTASLDIFMEKPGGRLGRYKLLSVLGEGGMGIVYLAEQKQPIRRQVALKVIKPGMDSKRVIGRFEAERQALALLGHPNIAHVYDAGTTETGRPYFVMEYVKGLSITEHCDHHKLTIEQRLRLFQQVCQAVQHAHQKGIIHRDIKPSNILVSMQDDKAVPKIIDFGVAKALAQPLTERTLATEDTQLLGTPEYMSPEQADMATEDIDTRSDIYSLGVLLYVLLTGVLPFDSETLREGGIENIRKTIRETDPKTPSTRLTKLGEKATAIAQNRRMEIQTLARNLRKELEWIPLKAMRKERSERYRSASELADDIENYMTGVPLIAGPPGTGYKLKKFVRRNRILVGGITAVLVVLIAGIVVSTVFAVGQARARAEAQSVADFLRQDLLESVSPTNSKGREVTVRSFLDTASGNLKAKFEKEPLVEASIRGTLGNVYRHLGEYRSAELHLEHACRLYQEHLGMEDRRTLKSMDGLFWIYFEQGRYIEAEETAVKTFEVSRRVLGEENADTLDSMNNVAFAYLQMGRYEESELLYKKLLEICNRVLGEEERLTLSVIGNLPWVYLLQRRYDEAEKLFNKALELQRRVWGENHPWTLVRMSNLAGVYHGQGRYNEAERQYLKTLEMQRRVIGEEHVYTLWSMNGLAQLYTGEGRYEEAKQQFVKTLEICRRILGEEHPDTLNNLNGLSVLYMKQGDFDKAEPLLLEAVDGRRLKLGDTHPHTLKSWNNLIELYEAWNKPEKAKQWRAKLQQIETLER